MFSSVVKGMKSHLHSLPTNVMGFDPSPACFVECLERISPFFLPDAVLHDLQQGSCKGEGGIVLKPLVDRHHISLHRSLIACCAGGLSSLPSMIRRKRS